MGTKVYSHKGTGSRSIDLLKTRKYNGQVYRKHWVFGDKPSAVKTAAQLRRAGWLTRIQGITAPHMIDKRGRWYILWKRRKAKR